MSISNALSIAQSGLNVAARTTEVISDNVANAMTEGYGKRSVETSSMVGAGHGHGAQVTGVSRHSDPVLIGQRRGADADYGAAETQADFYADLEMAIGTPDQDGSLNGQIDRFEASLIGAANAPDSDAALAEVLASAQSLTKGLNDTSTAIQDQREQADAEIGASVEMLNQSLAELAQLNEQIVALSGRGADISGLLDRQQVVTDGIAELVPVREMRNSSGTLRLYSSDGVALLDVTAAEFSFETTPVITADMTQTSGALSGLSVNGKTLDMSGAQMSGGRLEALFQIRDTDAVEAQAQLDAIARDLAERFEDPGLDPTRTATDPGLFTDAGSLTDPADEVGLAGRLSVNALVDPDAGGDLFRLRDGLGAAAPGNAGDTSILNAMLDGLNAPRVTASGAFSTSARGLSDLSTEFLSSISVARQGADLQLSSAASSQATLREEELRGGVNTDAEMQHLILVEQVYAANARVIEVADEMLDDIMRMLG